MIINKIKNVFEVTEQDTLSTAIIKGAVVGYGKGLLVSGISMGVMIGGLALIGNYVENSKEDEEEKELEDEETVEKMVETSFAKANLAYLPTYL